MARRDAVASTLLQADETTNLSLWLDRYAPGFDQEVMRQHHATALDRIRVAEGYRGAFQRRERALGAMCGGYQDGETRLFNLMLHGRAILGIGMASVRETNLSLLRPWGVPFIPGSALKGLASHVAHDLGEEWHRPEAPGEKAGKLQRALFGDVTSAGAVVFHDAWWKPSGERAPVHADTMTAHHTDYHQGKAAPADWDEPNPVSFLTVSGTYLAALTGPVDALEIVEELLRSGLQNCGIGAKTAAGYGRATFEEHLSDITRKLRDFTPGTAAANTVQQHAQAFLLLASQAHTAEEKRAAAEAAQRMVQASPAIWKKWFHHPARTHDERQWFRVEPSEPATPQPVPSARVEETSVAIQRRRVRVRYIQDKKSSSRYFLRIEGEPKDIKGHLFAIPPSELERVRSGGDEGAILELEYENGKPKLKSAKKV